MIEDSARQLPGLLPGLGHCCDALSGLSSPEAAPSGRSGESCSAMGRPERRLALAGAAGEDVERSAQHNSVGLERAVVAGGVLDLLSATPIRAAEVQA